MKAVTQLFAKIIKFYLVVVLGIFVFAKALDIDRSSLLVESTKDLFSDSYILISLETKKNLTKPRFNQIDLEKLNSQQFDFLSSLKNSKLYLEIFKPPQTFLI